MLAMKACVQIRSLPVWRGRSVSRSSWRTLLTYEYWNADISDNLSDKNMNIAVGTTLGRYEIRSQLGAGGMGEVYRARDGKLNRDVAIKVLPAVLSQDPDRLLRFEQEAEAAGALNHPNILAVYDVGMHDDSPYIVSELLEGEE